MRFCCFVLVFVYNRVHVRRCVLLSEVCPGSFVCFCCFRWYRFNFVVVVVVVAVVAAVVFFVASGGTV